MQLERKFTVFLEVCCYILDFGGFTSPFAHPWSLSLCWRRPLPLPWLGGELWKMGSCFKCFWLCFHTSPSSQDKPFLMSSWKPEHLVLATPRAIHAFEEFAKPAEAWPFFSEILLTVFNSVDFPLLFFFPSLCDLQITFGDFLKWCEVFWSFFSTHPRWRCFVFFFFK